MLSFIKIMDKNYKFGEFYLDINSRNLLHHENLIRLSPRAFDILLYLIKHQGQVVSKDEILENVWADSFVEENNLAVHISALRRVLKERVFNTKHIETISGRGYCFLTPVTEVNSNVFSTLSANRSLEPSEIRSIAVLPFVNKNNDEKFDYLAEGITDSLISNLSNISQLKVISYNAVSQYKDQQSNLREVGFLLGVDSLLIGNIIEIDEKLEIRVELVKVSDLSHIWGTQYHCQIEHLFKTKTEIAVAIADKLQIQLTKSETKQLAKQSTESSDAYKYYLKGQHFSDTRTKQGLLKAIDCFNEALKIDAKFAPAYAQIAYAYTHLANSYFIPVSDAVSKARMAIQKALKIDEGLAEAHAANGYLQLFELDLAGAEKSLKYAVELNQNSWFAHAHYALYLIAVGDFRSTLDHHYKSIELSPHIISYSNLSTKLMMMGEYQKAINNVEEYIGSLPNRGNIHYVLAFSYAQLKKFDLALKNALIAINITSSTENTALYCYIQALFDNHNEALKILNELINNFQNAPIDLYDIAVIYSSLGKNDKAFEYLEKAFDSKFSHLFMLKIDPRLQSLHSDSRFESLLRRIGLA